MKKTLTLILSMLVLILTPVCWHHANINEHHENDNICSNCDHNSCTMSFIDTMFERLESIDPTMSEAREKWDIAKKHNDVSELCLYGTS